MTDSVKGALLTMFGGMCWGVSGCVGQYLFTRQGMDSTWLVPIRLFLAGVILCIYYGVRNWRQLVNPWRSWRNARDLVIYGLAGVSFCQFTYFFDHPAFQRRCGHHFAGSFPRADSAGGLHPAKACAAAV